MGVNDYGAYWPGDPARTMLLIPHPPHAMRFFWTRKPAAGQRQDAVPGQQESRVDRYARLAAIVPVIAVFGSAEVARQYAPLLRIAGFEWALIGGIKVLILHQNLA